MGLLPVDQMRNHNILVSSFIPVVDQQSIMENERLVHRMKVKETRQDLTLKNELNKDKDLEPLLRKKNQETL